MERKAAAKRIAEQLIEAYVPMEGKMAVDPARVREIISSDLDATAHAYPVMLQASIQSGNPLWGLLKVVAEVYRSVTDGDDSLSVMLNQALEESGAQLPGSRWVLRPDSEQDASPGPETPQGIVLKMAPDDVRAGSAFRMVRLMSVETMPPDHLDRFLGHCILTLPLDDDPRPIWRIPEARRFMADLHGKLPYFPMYLNLDPQLGQHLTYYGCLADESAIVTQGENVSLNLGDDSIVQRIRESVISIQEKCALRGLSHDGIVADLIGVYPDRERRSLFGDLLTS